MHTNIKFPYIYSSMERLLNDPSLQGDGESLIKLRWNLIQTIRKHKEFDKSEVKLLSDILKKINSMLLEIKNAKQAMSSSIMNNSKSITETSVDLCALSEKQKTSIHSKNYDKHTYSHIDEERDRIQLKNSNETSITSASRLQQLLKSQKDLTSFELEKETKIQNELSNEMAKLTFILKEVTMQINESVRMQNLDLDSLKYHAIDNASELDNQRKKMNAQENRATTTLLTTISSTVAMILAFVLTYIIIRLFPSPR